MDRIHHNPYLNAHRMTPAARREAQHQAAEQQHEEAKHAPEKQASKPAHTLSSNAIPDATLKAYFMPNPDLGKAKTPVQPATALADTTTSGEAVSADGLVTNVNASKTFGASIAKLALQLPKGLQKFLANHTVQIQAVHDLGSDGLIPGFGQAVGIYYPSENVIKIPEFIRVFDVSHPAGVLVKNPEADIEVLRHESGHAVDRWLGDDTDVKGTSPYPNYYSFSPAFVKAYAKDLANLTTNVPDPNDRATLDYITNTSSGVDRARIEAFAETFAAIIGGSPRPSKLVLAAFPTYSKLIRELIANHGIQGKSTAPKPKPGVKPKYSVKIIGLLAQKMIKGSPKIPVKVNILLSGNPNKTAKKGFGKITTETQQNFINGVPPKTGTETDQNKFLGGTDKPGFIKRLIG